MRVAVAASMPSSSFAPAAIEASSAGCYVHDSPGRVLIMDRVRTAATIVRLMSSPQGPSQTVGSQPTRGEGAEPIARLARGPREREPPDRRELVRGSTATAVRDLTSEDLPGRASPWLPSARRPVRSCSSGSQNSQNRRAQGAERQGGWATRGKGAKLADGRFGKQTLCQLSYSRSGVARIRLALRRRS
jgi:hypothetical protein